MGRPMPPTIYAATDGGLSVSTDGGSSWTNYVTSNNIVSVFATGSTNYAAGGNNGLYVSKNAGASWTNYVNPTTAGFVASPVLCV